MRILLASTCLALLGAAAWAGPREQAGELMQLGNARFRAGDYLGALEQFVRARSLLPSYRIDFNIGISLAKLGRDIEAASNLEAFLREAAEVPEREMVAHARSTLAQLQARLGRFGLLCPLRGAEVLVDDVRVGRTPLPGWIYLRPGRHTVAVRAQHRRLFARALTLGPGDHLHVMVSFVPLADESSAASRPTARSTPIYRRWWVWASLGVLVAGAVAGGVAGWYYTRHIPSGELRPDVTTR